MVQIFSSKYSSMLLLLIFQQIYWSCAYTLQNPPHFGACQCANFNNYGKLVQRRQVLNYEPDTSLHILSSGEEMNEEFWKKYLGDDYKNAIHLDVNRNTPSQTSYSAKSQEDSNIKTSQTDKSYEGKQQSMSVDPKTYTDTMSQKWEDTMKTTQNKYATPKPITEPQPIYIRLPDHQKVIEVHESKSYMPIVINKSPYTNKYMNNEEALKYWEDMAKMEREQSAMNTEAHKIYQTAPHTMSIPKPQDTQTPSTVPQNQYQVMEYTKHKRHPQQYTHIHEHHHKKHFEANNEYDTTSQTPNYEDEATMTQRPETENVHHYEHITYKLNGAEKENDSTTKHTE